MKNDKTDFDKHIDKKLKENPSLAKKVALEENRLETDKALEEIEEEK